MAFPGNLADRLLLGSSFAISFVMFGFVAWKPNVWVSLTPFRPCDDVKLAKIYRWIAVLVVVSLAINLWVFYE